MKLNDPFGRMEKRHQVGYESMREALRNGGIETEEAARQVIEKARLRAIKFIGVTLALVLLVYLLMPTILPGVLGVALLVSVWLITWTVNGKRYIERYIAEELRGRHPAEITPPDAD